MAIENIPMHTWIQPYVDRGKLRFSNGNVLFGADPHISVDGSTFILHRTFGPTKPGAGGQGTGYPGIFQTTSTSLGGLQVRSAPEIVLAPWPPSGFGDDCGNEVFNMCQNWAGDWIGLYHGYRFGQRSVRAEHGLYGFTATSPRGPFTKTGKKVAEDPAIGVIQTMGEPTIVKHTTIPNRLEGAFMAVSYRNDITPIGTASRTYRIWSNDDGATWGHSTIPFLNPEGVREQAGTFNSYHQGEIVVDDRPGEPVVYNMLITHGGKVSLEQRGLVHWAALETDLDTWYPNPNGTDPYGRLISFGDPLGETGTNMAAPTWYRNPTTFELSFLFSGQNSALLGSTTLETRGRLHIRMATEGP